MAEKENDDFGGLLIDKTGQASRKAEGYITIYANNVQLTASVFDFSLTFGEITDEKQDDKNVISQKARVILSKEMTKVLAVLLGRNVSAYEEIYGEIVLPNPNKIMEAEPSTASRKKKKIQD
jgi:hypothetical protein